MTKVSVNVSPKDWGNLITKYSADSKKLTNGDFTAGTSNIDSDVTGNITKRKGGPKYNPVALAASPKDQYEAIFSDGTRHLLVVQSGELKYSSGDSIFNTVVNGSGFSAGANFEMATTQDRVYMGNGVNASQVYDRNTSYGGVAYTAPQMRAAGAHAPVAAPTVAVVAGGSVPVGAHTYKITFLYYDSEESNGGPASAVATTTPGNQTVNLSAIPIGGYGVTARKVYRDNNDGLWLHVGTVANNTATTFSDTVAVGVTPTEIPTDNGVPPAFRYVTLWLDRLFEAGVPGNPYTLFYSEPGLPDINLSANQILCNQEDPITALIVYYDRLIVFNRRSVGQILGKTSDTFRYAKIPGSVGCVDNRTLQTRVIEGVPVLIWLSDRGFYTYDGNSINYISDWIEDLVNFNIQQATQQKNSNTQTSQAHFLAGTASQGIDLTFNPGTITTKGYQDGTSAAGTNPRRDWNDQGDWEGGSIKSNVVTRDGSNQLKSPTRFEPAVTSGTFNNTVLNAGNIRLTTSSAFNGEGNITPGGGLTQISGTNNGPIALAVPIIPARTGTITRVFANLGPITGSSSGSYDVSVQTDNAGSPSNTAVPGSLGTIPVNTISPGSLAGSTAIAGVLTGGVKYWIVFRGFPSFRINHIKSGGVLSGGQTLGQSAPAGPWGIIFNDPFPFPGIQVQQQLAAAYQFTYTPVAKSGTWTSPIHDSSCAFFDTAKSYLIEILNTNIPLQTSIQFEVQGSNEATFLSSTVVSNDTSGTSATHALQNFRYWRVKLTLTTLDDISTPATTGPRLSFTTNPVTVPQEWVSEAIDTTADVTVYNSLTMVSSTPAGTSITMQIATSPDDIIYTSFVTFGSHLVQRYAKIKLTLVMNSDQTLTPSVTSVVFTWTLVSNLISSGIDTAVVPPAGWDIFLATFVTNGGTVSFQMRSATTLGGLTAATFQNVTSGDFPAAVTPLQFAQWKVIITSSNNMVPTIDSVTVQWFISSVASLRPASIFVDSRYYVALAELNQTANNLLLELDLNGKWRRVDGLQVSTFSFFFNRPYLGLATSGFIRKFLEGTTDDGAAITLDVRTKAFDFSTTEYDNHSDRVKIVTELILEGKGTGAAFQVSYSLDLGETFINMYTDSGSTTFTSINDNQNFYVRFKPLWDGSNPFAGRTVLYRILNTDTNEVEIRRIKASAMVREQEPVITG